MLYFHFHSSFGSVFSKVSFEIYSLIHELFRNVLLHLKVFRTFPVVCYWYLIWPHCGQRRHSMISIFFNSLILLFYGPGFGQSWQITWTKCVFCLLYVECCAIYIIYIKTIIWYVRGYVYYLISRKCNIYWHKMYSYS